MIHLIRTDPDRNMARFYAMHLAPTLFGDWQLMKEWGRIGQGGTVRADSFPDEAAARAALHRIVAVKTRKGYRAAQA